MDRSGHVVRSPRGQKKAAVVAQREVVGLDLDTLTYDNIPEWTRQNLRTLNDVKEAVALLLLEAGYGSPT